MDSIALPPASVVVAPDRRPIATGDGPRWTLSADGPFLLLAMEDGPARRFRSPRWSDTPDGRRLSATDANGNAMSLVLLHAVCPAADTDAPAPGRMIAILHVDGRRLGGCTAAGGRPPYPGR